MTTHPTVHGGMLSTFLLVKAKHDMCVLNLEALVPIAACLLQVKEDGNVDKGMRIEVALPNLHTQVHTGWLWLCTEGMTPKLLWTKAHHQAQTKMRLGICASIAPVLDGRLTVTCDRL